MASMESLVLNALTENAAKDLLPLFKEFTSMPVALQPAPAKATIEMAVALWANFLVESNAPEDVRKTIIASVVDNLAKSLDHAVKKLLAAKEAADKRYGAHGSIADILANLMGEINTGPKDKPDAGGPGPVPSSIAEALATMIKTIKTSNPGIPVSVTVENLECKDCDDEKCPSHPSKQPAPAARDGGDETGPR